jgi:hypothetical protein
MRRKLKNSIRLQSKISLQLWKTDNGDINRAWETIRETIRILAKESIRLCESKSYTSWFVECLKLVDRRKQAKLQRFQDPSVVNEDNLRNVRMEASRHFRNKKREYLKAKLLRLY